MTAITHAIDVLKLGNNAVRRNNMRFLIFLIASALLMPGITFAAQECQWAQFSVGSSCGQTLDTDWRVKVWNQADITNCQVQNKPIITNSSQNVVCCCKAIVEKKNSNIKPKYIIIASVAGGIGVITVLSFILKKREYEV